MKRSHYQSRLNSYNSTKCNQAKTKTGQRRLKRSGRKAMRLYIKRNHI